MIEINNLTFSYKKSFKLFDSLNLSTKKGHIYGLLGKNGAGKTTLLKQVSGLLFPKDGTCSIDQLPSKSRSPEFLKKFYFIPEEFNTPSISVNKYIKIYSPFYPNFSLSDYEDYASQLNVPERTGLNKMSYGQKKKFLLAFGLACNTDVVIMDEPTNGLDIPSKSTFRKIITAAINEDKVFIISTHQIRDIDSIIDGVIILDNGVIRFNNFIDEISEKIKFTTTTEGDTSEDILYSEPGLGGNKSICKNTTKDYTKPDMEILFNAVIAKNSKLVNYLNN